MNTSTPTPAPQTIANPHTMPTPVRVSILLLGVTLLIGLLGALWGLKQMQALFESAPNTLRYSVLGSLAFSIVLTGAIMAGLVWRKNWARITQLVLTLLSLAMLLMGPQFAAAPAQPALTTFISNVSMVANIVATYLLFCAGGKVWFRRDEPEHV